MAELNTGGTMSGAAAGSNFGPWGAVAGGVIGGFMGGSGDDAAREAEAKNLAFQKQMYEQQDPFSAGGNRAQYVPQLNQLMQSGYAGLQNDTMYQGLQQQGQQAIERSMSARGMGGSGNMMSALLKQNQSIGMDYFNQQYNRLSELSGAKSGRTAPMQGMSSGEAYNSAMGKQSAMGAGFGSVVSGLEAIFGNPRSSDSAIGSPGGYSVSGSDNEYSGYHQEK